MNAPTLSDLLAKFKEYSPNQDTSLIEKAYHFAQNAHKDQKRESGEPYFTHCCHVANILMDFNLDADTICAGLLHDTVEDTDITLDVLRAEFGERVAKLVADESDVFTEGKSEEETWHQRKKAAIDRLARAPHDAKIVALGDKLSNMRAIARDYAAQGDALWNIFHAKDPKDHEWHYRGLADALRELQDTPAFQEFEQLINQVFA